MNAAEIGVGGGLKHRRDHSSDTASCVEQTVLVLSRLARARRDRTAKDVHRALAELGGLVEGSQDVLGRRVEATLKQAYKETHSVQASGRLNLVACQRADSPA